MPLVLGVDSSTQATKVEVRDADTGELVAHGRAPHPPTTPPHSEQDPQGWWDALAAARAAADAPGPIAAMAVAGQQHGMVALDADGVPVHPAKLWNDTESAPDARWLREQLDDAGWAEACGSVPVAAHTITKLSWLHRTDPDAFARIAHVLLPHDWLTWRLTGRFVTDRGDASGTGYFSARDDEWRPDLLAIVDRDRDWPAQLPEVLGPIAVAGEHEGALVAAGTGDNMGAALGVGLRPGDRTVSLGTSGTAFAMSESATADASGAVDGFADATGRFLPLVCTLNATKVTEAFARLLGVDHEDFDALALDAPMGAGGLTLVPYFDGERTPDRPDATGTLTGLRTDVDRAAIARAAVEGVVCGLLDGLDALDRAGVPGHGLLFLVGGGARSAAYRRVLADLAGRPVVVPHHDELVARGACVQAAAALHAVDPSLVAQEWGVRDGVITAPDDSPGADDRRAAVRSRYAAAASA